MTVVSQVEWQRSTARESRKRFENAPLARLHEHQTGRPEPLYRAFEFLSERPRVVFFVEPMVVACPAPLFDLDRKMAHRREEQNRSSLVARHVARLFFDLGHPDHVARGIETVEGGGLKIELIAQDDNNISNGHVGEDADRECVLQKMRLPVQARISFNRLELYDLFADSRKRIFLRSFVPFAGG